MSAEQSVNSLTEKPYKEKIGRPRKTDPKITGPEIRSILSDPPARKQIDPEAVLALYEKGYSYSQIAKLLKVSKTTVYFHLCKIRGDKELDKFYVDHRPLIIRDLQRRLITSINEEDIQKTPVGSRILGFAQLFDKERLLEEKSTVNQAVMLGVAGQARDGLAGISGALSRLPRPLQAAPLSADQGSDTVDHGSTTDPPDQAEPAGAPEKCQDFDDLRSDSGHDGADTERI